MDHSHVPKDHFRDNVQSNLLVGDGLDSADGNEEDEANQDANYVRPPRQMGSPDERRNEPKGEAYNENGQEPVLGGFFIFAH